MITAEGLLTEEVDEIELEVPEDDVGNASEAEEVKDGEEAAAKIVPPKKVVRKPQPKLNEQTLKGKRGLLALETCFNRVKFKGRGYEEEDLSIILKTYEYWCHRLFPKFPFDSCIAKIENLGAKRAVVTELKRIRANLHVFDDRILNDADSDTEPVPLNYDEEVEQPRTVEPAAPPEPITDEILDMIRINKAKAESIRLEKMRQQQLANDEM